MLCPLEGKTRDRTNSWEISVGIGLEPWGGGNPEHSRGSLPGCPLVFFHLCQGSQIVVEGILMMIIKSHRSLTVYSLPALVKCVVIPHNHPKS